MTVLSGSEEAAVRITDLQRSFGSFVAVDRISLSIARGEVFGFLGPNGSGKSTTIRMLCGILAPTGGSGSVAGFDILTQAEKIKSHIGYMSQRFSLYEDLTVEENLDYYIGIYRIPRDRAARRKDWVMSMPGLAEHRHSRVVTLSGGWKQRLSFCCAVLHEPPVIFLDEPTSGVDPVTRREFWEAIYDFSERGVTVFVTTHFLDEAEYCNRVGLIHRGKLIALGSPQELKTNLMRDQVLELRCDQPEAAMELLEALGSVSDVALFGNAIHMIARDAELASREARQRLGEHNLAIHGLARIAPSLEDVFVSLVEERDVVAAGHSIVHE